MSNVEHYGGEDNPYEVIKVAEAWGLDKDAYLFNVLKYIARAGKKPGESILKDLNKARDYIGYRLATLEREKVPASQELGELSIKRHAERLSLPQGTRQCTKPCMVGVLHDSGAPGCVDEVAEVG